MMGNNGFNSISSFCLENSTALSFQEIYSHKWSVHCQTELTGLAPGLASKIDLEDVGHCWIPGSDVITWELSPRTTKNNKVSNKNFTLKVVQRRHFVHPC